MDNQVQTKVCLTFDDQPYVLKSFEKPGEVALYYGFVPIESPRLSQKDWQRARTISPTNISNIKNRPGKGSQKEYELGLRIEEKCAFFRKYLDELTNLPHPLGIYYTLPLRGDTRTKVKGQLHQLEILDSRLPIADVTILKTAIEILKEEGHENVHVLINSVGDDQSKTRFRRELIEYFKAHIESIPRKAQGLIKDNVFTLMHYDDEALHSLQTQAPNSLDFLDETSRQRFMDVLEFLETLNIPYQINPTLVGDTYSEHTIFEIRNMTEDGTKGELLARGGRYSDIAKRCGSKKDVPSVGITLGYTPAQKTKREKYTFQRVDKPVCYFMQLGPMAKLKSLHIIESLRKAEIPLRHMLCKEKCFGQMSIAKQIQLPYLIIMGQKEALDNCVLVRNVTTYSQDIVPVDHLPNYMKKLVKRTS